MNSNSASQFMDKQIMDLSNSQSSSGNNEFIDFMNRSDEKRDDIVPSYDFMPIHPGVGSSAPLPAAIHGSKFDSGEEDGSLRTWNSLDSKINVPNRNQNTLDIDEPAKFFLGQSQKPLDASLSASLVSEIDETVKKYTDNLMHNMDVVSARLSQLETRTRNLENTMDDLKEYVGNNLGVIDGKLRQMTNILREVQTGVQVISDKQQRVGELSAAMLQSPNLEHVESQDLAHTELTQSIASVNHQFSTVSLTQPPTSLLPPNAPPPPPQNPESHVQFPNQYSPNQTTPASQPESYFPPSGQTPQQQYQVPQPPHQHHHPHLQHQLLEPPLQNKNQPPPPQHQHQPSPPQPQYSQPPPPQHQHQHQPPPPPHPHSQPPPPHPHSQLPPPPQLHPPFSTINTSLPQPPLSHHLDETMYGPTQTYPPGIRPPPSHPVGVPPPQQLYGPTPNAYDLQSSRPIPGYSHSFGQSAGPIEPYPYSGSPSQYGSDSPRKAQQLLSNASGVGGGSGYPHLPTARILPEAIPAASNVGGGSGSGGSGNKVPIDDVVEKVTHMGFPRDQVRATVRKLTENGQSVDLNVVLDKLMNDNDGQTPRGWFGR